MNLKQELINNLTCNKDQIINIAISQGREYDFAQNRLLADETGMWLVENISNEKIFIGYDEIKVTSLLSKELFVICELILPQGVNAVINIAR